MRAALSEPQLDLPAPQLDRLRHYAALLAKWTQRINLVSRTDAAHIWSRHILDSLRLLPLIPPGTDRAIDLGSGAGLPGLVLAIATDTRFELVEADRRKAAFLSEAARVTGASVSVHCSRIEELRIAPAPLVTARALAPLDTLLELTEPLLTPGGTALFPKGARVSEELAAAERRWRMQVRQEGSPDSPILIVTGIARG